MRKLSMFNVRTYIINHKSLKTTIKLLTKVNSVNAFPRSRVSINSAHAANRVIAKEKTVDEDEIRTFSNLADKWWDEDGEFKPLHSLNHLRVPLIRDGLINSGRISAERSDSGKPLEGVKILDVGCGGGLMSEPLARLGGEVVGLDASQESITIAKLHAEKMLLSPKYVCETIEDHATHNLQEYDAIVLSEVIEHIQNKDACIRLCTEMLQPGGSIFITTLNRTWLSRMGIVVSEYVLRFVPPDTHQYDKFISPTELQKTLKKYECSVRLIHGMQYNFFCNKWSWCNNTYVNFALQAVKLKY